MAKNRKHIVRWIMAGLLGAITLYAGMRVSHSASDPVCQQITVIISDSVEHQYVSTDELRVLLQQAGLWQVGSPLSAISCQDIERSLLAHPLIREALCYEKPTGEVIIKVRQRVPIIRVDADEHYYIDMDRTIIPPRASISTPVTVVSGHVGKQQATGELFDFVQWLTHDRYWRECIHSIHVTHPKMIDLTDDKHHYTIILGSLDRAQERMTDLRKLYEKGFEELGWPEYKQIDLRYKDQIVGRKERKQHGDR